MAARAEPDPRVPPTPFLPAAFVLRAARGCGAQARSGCQAPPLSPSSRCPPGSVYRRQKPWLREEPGRPGRASSSRLPGSPPPPPLASESRASGRLRSCQRRPQLTGPAGKAPRPRKRRTRDSPALGPTRPGGVPGRISSPQHKPAVAACRHQLSTIISALRGNDFYPHISTQGSQLTKSPLKNKFSSQIVAVFTQGDPLTIKDLPMWGMILASLEFSQGTHL